MLASCTCHGLLVVMLPQLAQAAPAADVHHGYSIIRILPHRAALCLGARLKRSHRLGCRVSLRLLLVGLWLVLIDSLVQHVQN